jgi:(2Fe-2S) ferredoxin
MTQIKLPAPKQVTSFRVEGQLLEVVQHQKHLVKALRLRTQRGEIDIKVAKVLRDRLRPELLRPGMTVEISGREIYDALTGRTKFKADAVESQSMPVVRPEVPPTEVSRCHRSAQPEGTILICRKCQEKSVCKALTTELAHRDLGDRVKVKFTGCLKRCKSAPNLVVIAKADPIASVNSGRRRQSSTHYSKVKCREIAKMLDRHGLSKPAS